MIENEAIPVDMRNAARGATGDKCGAGIGEAGDPAFTITANQNHAVAYGVSILEHHPQDSHINISDDNVVQTLSAKMDMGGGNVPLVMSEPPQHILTATCGNFTQVNEGISSTLMARDYKDPQIVCYQKGGTGYMKNINNALMAFHITQDPISSEAMTPCISAGSTNGQASVGILCTATAGTGGNNQPYLCTEYTVRRLTPLECERLQGFPDDWTDIGAWEDENGKPHKKSNDSARYKAIGNSIALPPWEYVLQRLSLCCSNDTTMASLFDGIGGFPLIWERLNGQGSCLWASEIEDFPIAVTKRHFGE